MRFRLTDVRFCVADAVTSINIDIISCLYLIVNPQNKKMLCWRAGTKHSVLIATSGVRLEAIKTVIF